MSNELNKFVRDLAEIRAMENVAKNTKLNQEILKGQEKHIKLEEERLEIEKKKILVLESEARERESAARKREAIKEKRKQIRKDGVALEEILRVLFSLVQKEINTSKGTEFRVLILNELCRRSFEAFEKQSVIFEDLEDLKFCSSVTSFFHELSDVIYEKLDQAHVKLFGDQFSQIDQVASALASLNSFKGWSGFQDAKNSPLKVTDTTDDAIPSMTTEELYQLSAKISHLASVLEEGPLDLKAMIEFSCEIHSKLAKREIDFYRTVAVNFDNLFKDPIFLEYCKLEFDFDLYIQNLKSLIKIEENKVSAFTQKLSKFNDEEFSLAEAEIAVKLLTHKGSGKFSTKIDNIIETFEKRKGILIARYTPQYCFDVKHIKALLSELNSNLVNFNAEGEIYKELIKARKRLMDYEANEISASNIWKIFALVFLIMAIIVLLS